MLQTNNLHYSYDRDNFLRFPDIHCKKGEQWLLLGQSGTGKTTLLHLLGGLRSPQKGSVMVAGKDISQMKSSQLDQFRGQHIGIIFQKSHFLHALTVEENLLLAQQLAGVKTSKSRVSSLLEHLNIADKIHSKTTALSQGEQQRVAIARALINRPDVILADEPTSALDDANCQEVIQLIEKEAQEVGATLLVVTHDQRLKALFPNHIVLRK
ncbi:MAG: ATP-binding cassette domain-containing protein [Bacteroidetes bacterium]|nr:ATP-binding cassette domain-containing protein [Bacteroidota bacterium]